MCLKCYVQHVLCLLFLVSNNLNVFLFHFSPSLSQSLFSKCLWIPISYIFISVEPDLPGWILGTNASGDLQGIKKESTVVKRGGGKAGIWWTENQWRQNCKHCDEIWGNLDFFIYLFIFLNSNHHQHMRSQGSAWVSTDTSESVHGCMLLFFLLFFLRMPMIFRLHLRWLHPNIHF